MKYFVKFYSDNIIIPGKLYPITQGHPRLKSEQGNRIFLHTMMDFSEGQAMILEIDHEILR